MRCPTGSPADAWLVLGRADLQDVVSTVNVASVGSLEGRITAVADVFDALSTQRPYKPAFPLDQCFSLMQEARGSHFDPAILDAFMARRDAIVAVQIAYADLG